MNGTVPGEAEGRGPKHRWKNIPWAGAGTQTPSPRSLREGSGDDEYVCWERAGN